MFSSSYEELIQDGKLNQENLVRLFQCWKKICDNLDTKGLETFYEYDSSEEIADINTYFYSGNTGILRPDRITTEDLQGLITMMLPCYEMANAGLSPKAIQQYYIPYTVVGVNAASEQQEIAKEFLLTLFSDEVQKSQTNDGFPVTEGGLNSLAEYVETAEAKDIIIGSSMMDAESGEEVKIDIGYPDGETMKSYIEMIRNLEKPFLPDQVFLETVMDEMESCYEGNQTPEEAARAAAQKMDTYLSE